MHISHHVDKDKSFYKSLGLILIEVVSWVCCCTFSEYCSTGNRRKKWDEMRRPCSLVSSLLFYYAVIFGEKKPTLDHKAEWEMCNAKANRQTHHNFIKIKTYLQHGKITGYGMLVSPSSMYTKSTCTAHACACRDFTPPVTFSQHCVLNNNSNKMCSHSY